MGENIIKKRLMSFAFEKTSHISLICKLCPIPDRENMVYSRDCGSRPQQRRGPLIIQLVWYNVYTKTIIHLSVRESDGYLPRPFVAQ